MVTGKLFGIITSHKKLKVLLLKILSKTREINFVKKLRKEKRSSEYQNKIQSKLKSGGRYKMTLTIVKRFNGMGKEIDETYQPVIPELVELLSEVYHKLNATSNAETRSDIPA